MHVGFECYMFLGLFGFLLLFFLVFLGLGLKKIFIDLFLFALIPRPNSISHFSVFEDFTNPLLLIIFVTA